MYNDVMPQMADDVSFQKQQIPPSLYTLFQNLTQSSHQVIRKGEKSVIEAVRYNVIPEPSTLRPIKSWLLEVEEWSCDEVLGISSHDILTLRVIHAQSTIDLHGYTQFIKDATIYGAPIKIDTESGFNALMAFILLKSKIEAGRFPDVQKIMKLHHLSA